MKRILLLEKVTELTHYVKDSDGLKLRQGYEDRLIKLLKDDKDHNTFTLIVENLLKDTKINYDRIKIDKIGDIDFSKYNLIITSGGDGTFLQAAAKINEQLIIGLNSVYTDSNRGSTGGLTTVNKKNLYELRRIFTKDYNIQKWKRLYVKLNDHIIDDLAVNDVYIGHSKAYVTSHLEVTIEPDSECFLSSGIIISTGMGSHAWFRSAGGTQFKNELDIFGLIVREPFEKREKYKFTSKILSGKEVAVICPNRDGCIIIFDSKNKEHIITVEDRITVGLSDNSVNVINFNN